MQYKGRHCNINDLACLLLFPCLGSYCVPQETLTEVEVISATEEYCKDAQFGSASISAAQCLSTVLMHYLAKPSHTDLELGTLEKVYNIKFRKKAQGAMKQ